VIPEPTVLRKIMHAQRSILFFQFTHCCVQADEEGSGSLYVADEDTANYWPLLLAS
jgi:hypothetical protein